MIYPLFCLLPIFIMVNFLVIGGYDYFAPLTYIFTITIVLFLERLIPWNSNWLFNQGDTKLDIKYLLGNLTLSSIAFAGYSFLYSKFPSPISTIGLNPYLQYFAGLLVQLFEKRIYFRPYLSSRIYMAINKQRPSLEGLGLQYSDWKERDLRGPFLKVRGIEI